MNEQWRPVERFNGFYEVSSLGRVRSLDRSTRIRAKKNGKEFHFTKAFKGKLLKPIHDKDGYALVCFKANGVQDTARIHQEVAHAFIPNPLHRKAINHKNSVRDDNRVENLEWCSNQENTNHMMKFGKGVKVGEAHPLSIFEEEDIRKIKVLVAMGYTYAGIASLYKCHWSTIQSIERGETWKHVK